MVLAQAVTDFLDKRKAPEKQPLFVDFYKDLKAAFEDCQVNPIETSIKLKACTFDAELGTSEHERA